MCREPVWLHTESLQFLQTYKYVVPLYILPNMQCYKGDDNSVMENATDYRLFLPYRCHIMDPYSMAQ